MLLKVTDLRIVDICIIVHKWMFVNEFVRVELMKTNSYVHTSAVWQMNISVFFHRCKNSPTASIDSLCKTVLSINFVFSWFTYIPTVSGHDMSHCQTDRSYPCVLRIDTLYH